MSEQRTTEGPAEPADPADPADHGGRAHALWRFIASVVDRPVTVTMITVALLLFGLVALTRMPVELLPELGYPSITVQTTYPDAAPAEVEELVTRPIEELVGAVPGLVAVESTSREGLSEVVLDFAWGTRIDDAMADVREKLDRVRLPTESERPIVLRYDPSQEPILRLALVVEAADGVTNFKAMRDLADEKVKQVLEKLDGVAAVQMHGGDEEEVVVELDPDRLAALGIDASEVVAAIGADNINRPGGGLTDDGNRYLIRTVHEAKTPEQLGEIIIREGTEGAGGRLRLRDLTVDPHRGIRRAALEREEVSLVATGSESDAGPSEAIELAVFREGDANTVRVAEQVLERVELLLEQLPEGHELVVLSNQASFIDAAIDEVALNTLIGGGLAILVLLFFLRDLRSTLVIGVAIPISLLVTFVPLSILGVSLNLMSLGGLALGVGMLVDNSIVTLESIARVREEQPGLSRSRSAVRGSVEIAKSVVASTLTTVAVFFPMAFVDGVAGQLVRDLAYAVSFSILSSMIVSLTLVPVLQALGSDAEVPEPEGRSKRSLVAWLVAIPALLWVPIRLLVRGLGWLLGMLAKPLMKVWELLEAQYPKLLRVALRARVPVLLVSAAICAVVFAAGRDLGRTLLPEVRQGEVYVQLELPQGTSLERTTALTRAIMRELESDDRLEMVFARAGSMTQGGSATGGQVGTHLAQVNVRLREDLSASAQLDAIEDELFVSLSEISERTLDGIEHRVRLGRPELLSFESPIEVQVFADETSDAVTHALRVLPRLREIEGLADISADDLSGRPEVRIDFDRERLGRVGLDVDRAATAVQRAIQGELAGVMHAVDKQLDIRVRLPEVDRSDVEDVQRIQVGVIAGSTDAMTGQVTPPKSIPLVAVASVEPSLGPAEIRRIDGRRGLRIRARAEAGDLATLAAQIEETLDVARAEIPVGSFVEAELAGQAEEMSESLQSLAFTALLAIFLVYVVMASSFESLLHPFLIMFTVPLAAVGVVLACLLTNTPISAMVGIGGIILGGIVVNNAIVLVDAVNQRRGRGMDVNSALIEAGPVRLRPILMTTATTVLGLLPMAFMVGEGAALRQPLALSVIGGLVVSTALTLIVIPVVYSLAPGRKRAAWGEAESAERDTRVE
jgi:multidrug efflux pump subunit AcrB